VSADGGKKPKGPTGSYGGRRRDLTEGGCPRHSRPRWWAVGTMRPELGPLRCDPNAASTPRASRGAISIEASAAPATVGTSERDWRVPRYLSAPDVEAWLVNFLNRPEDPRLVLGQFHRAGPEAAARLQGAICLLQRKGRRVEFSVPPITFSGRRARDAYRGGAKGTATEDALAHSLAGLLIGQLCDPSSPAAARVSSVQKAYLESNRNVYGSGISRSLAVVNQDDRRLGLSQSRARHAVLENRLRRDLLTSIARDNLRASKSRWLSALTTFAFEATENTFDHARHDLEGNVIRSVRFLSVHRLDVGKRFRSPEQLAPGPDTAMRRYLDTLRALDRAAGRDWDRGGAQLLEVTIGDGGVGIAARMASSLDVYGGPLQAEYMQIYLALLEAGTTKESGQVGRGQGFRKMLRACRDLDGLFLLRSGRLGLSRTYLHDDGPSPQVDFTDPSAFQLAGAEAERPLVAGTTISLTFPLASVSTASGNHHT
jgi:hypothetical protein